MTAPRRVLVVDDDVDSLRLVGMMLERKGFEIIAAVSGQQAIEKAMQGQPDLIILDVMMPDMDGYQVASQLRRHPATEVIPILMFTARNAVNDRIAGMQAGADDYLAKPVSPHDLVTRVDALLQRQRRPTGPASRNNIVSFLPAKGGLGTTALSLNTALEMKRMYPAKQVALVELREGGGAIALQLGVQASDGLDALLSTPLPQVTQNAVAKQMVESSAGLHILLSTSRPCGTTHKISGSYARTILCYLSLTYDYVIVDLPASLDEGYVEALRMAASIIVTLGGDRVSEALAMAVINGLTGLGIDLGKTKAVVLQRNPTTAPPNRAAVEESLHCKVIASVPAVPEVADESMRIGEPMVLLQPQGLFAQQVRGIIQSIVQG